VPPHSALTSTPVTGGRGAAVVDSSQPSININQSIDQFTNIIWHSMTAEVEVSTA